MWWSFSQANCSRKPGFFLLQPGVSKSHTRRGESIRPVICRAWYLVWTLMLLFHSLSSLTIAGVAVMTHARIFTLQVPPFKGVAPMYLKLDTFSSGLPAIVTLTLVLLAIHYYFSLSFHMHIPCSHVCTFHVHMYAHVYFNSMTDIKIFLQNSF